jgi:hypothetical protein
MAIERLIASITMNIGVTPLPLSSRLPPNLALALNLPQNASNGHWGPVFYLGRADSICPTPGDRFGLIELEI